MDTHDDPEKLLDAAEGLIRETWRRLRVIERTGVRRAQDATRVIGLFGTLRDYAHVAIGHLVRFTELRLAAADAAPERQVRRARCLCVECSALVYWTAEYARRTATADVAELESPDMVLPESLMQLLTLYSPPLPWPPRELDRPSETRWARTVVVACAAVIVVCAGVIIGKK
ncbi:MAG: hypothetical protein WC732_08520 [Candidatus Omnitrophota bacterium]